MKLRQSHEQDSRPLNDERGFSLTELVIALMVFTVIMGSVITLLTKSQMIFRTEQGVSEMDQNARLLMDFLTRDIQQSKENGLGLGPKFRSIYSYNGPEGKTDAVTIISSDTETRIPSGGLPLVPASMLEFSAADGYAEMVPNGSSGVKARDIVSAIQPNEEFIVSATLQDGTVQYDFIKVSNARLTHEGAIGLSFQAVNHNGVQPEIPHGRSYQGGSYTMRPVTVKRYFVDRSTDKDHPNLALSVNEGTPVVIARNIVAFQLRYLEVQDGQVEGEWVKQQNISNRYKTQAVEVTMTARTEVDKDPQAERLITLASVVRPRNLPSGEFGSSGGSSGAPGFPGPGSGSGGPGGGDGSGFPGDGRGGPGGSGFPGGGPSDTSFGGPGGSGSGAGFDGPDGFGRAGYNYRDRRIGKAPKLGERLNPR
jgi:prepilin-type N-terminal cleavage/methylation domain-containing protein